MARDLVAHAPEHRQLLVLRPYRGRRIVERPMQLCAGGGKVRARLLRLLADGDRVIETLAVVLADVLAALAADVDADLVHGTDGQWTYESRLVARAVRFEPLPAPRTEHALGHLRAGAVVDTQEEHPDRRRVARLRGVVERRI